jgi:hypothetical protein
MHRFDFEDAVEDAQKPSYTLCLWAFCALLLLGPSALVWIVRLTALLAHCDPGPGLCHGLGLGGGLRDTLGLAWIIGSNTFLALVIALASAVFALSSRKPLMAAMGLLLLPIAAVVLPSLAVVVSSYAGCQINEDGIGDCVLWGAKMGMSFHEAAIASSALYDMVPYSFALALMVGAIGFVFFRPKEAR